MQVPGISYYRGFGLQARATIRFKRALRTTDTGYPAAVTINGDEYVQGTDFFGDTPAELARSLSTIINGTLAASNVQDRTNKTPDSGRAYFAHHYGSLVRLTASVPGIAGNLFTLTVDDDSVGSLDVLTEWGGGTAGAPITAVASINQENLEAVVDYPLHLTLPDEDPHSLDELIETLGLDSIELPLHFSVSKMYAALAFDGNIISTDNSQTVYIGFERDGDFFLPEQLVPQANIQWNAPSGGYFLTTTVYVQGTTGDGILFVPTLVTSLILD